MHGQKAVCLVLIITAFLLVPIPSQVFAISEFNWELRAYRDFSVACAFSTSDANPPGNDVLRIHCGDRIASEFALTPQCDDPTFLACDGYFLRGFSLQSDPHEDIWIDSSSVMGLREIEIRPLNCEPNAICDQIPIIEFSVRSQSDAQSVFQITIDNEDFTCAAPVCQIALAPPSSKKNSWITASLIDPEGTSGKLHHIFFRFKRLMRSPDLFFLEWLWCDRFGDSLYGAENWYVVPSPLELARLDGTVLAPSQTKDNIYTEYQLYGLCAEFIRNGTVRARDCPGFGLLDGKTPNRCGIDACREQVILRQNDANQQITRAGTAFRIPPGLLKNVLLGESQFTKFSGQPGEIGAGHLTQLGVDTLLRWSPSTFASACAEVYPLLPELCAAGYEAMDEPHRRLLRGVIVREARADEGIMLSARILFACERQVGWIIIDLRNRPLQHITDYQTLWKLSVATYHAGAECTRQAITRTVKQQYAIQWTNIRRNYVGKCRSAPAYVDIVFSPDYPRYPPLMSSADH